MVIPASAFQAVNAFFIILLAPIFSYWWIRLGVSGREPSIPVKFGMAIVQLGLGFGALYLGASFSRETGVVPMFWLILGYFLHTSGELCLSPVGLSAMTKLSPGKIVGLMMGTWFLASSYSQYVGALIAKQMGISEGGGDAATEFVPADTVMVYGEVFGKITVVALGVGLVILVFSPLMKRLLHGVK